MACHATSNTLEQSPSYQNHSNIIYVVSLFNAFVSKKVFDNFPAVLAVDL